MKGGLLASLFAIFTHLVLSADALVETTSGWVRGFSQKVGSSSVKTYLGIPFAEPPVKQFRFHRPLPVKPWKETLNATSWRNSCFQTPFSVFQNRTGEKSENIWNPNTDMNEDCLHLNIWVPEVSDNSKLTTMVWIYGGGFITGSATLDLYDGKMLAAMYKVIVISINYRLGPLGFLYFGHEQSPGNMGLLDQQLALQWIHSNIQKFGGLQSEITLFGESAGAASVSYHIMSNASQNLFNRAIMQSATALAHWAYQSPDIARKYANLLAEKANCLQREVTNTIECLRNVDPYQLAQWTWELPITPISFNIIPTLDNYFISQTPIDFFSSGNLPRKDIFLGVNKNEAMYFLFYALADKIKWPENGLTRQDYIEAIPVAVSSSGLEKLDIQRDQLIIDAIFYRYESHLLPGDQRNYMMLLDDISGDFAFKCPVVNLAQRYAATSSKVYMYEFAQRPSVSSWPDWTGVLHGDEVEFIFGKPQRPSEKYTEQEQQLSDDMMQFWTQFAKAGRPSLEWLPYTKEGEEYRILKADQTAYDVLYKRGLKHSECIFWGEYLPKLKQYTQKESSGNSNGASRNGAHFLVLLSTVIFMAFKQQ